MRTLLVTTALLIGSNVFTTLAWYGRHFSFRGGRLRAQVQRPRPSVSTGASGEGRDHPSK